MLNLKRQGCLAIFNRRYQDEMFYVYVPDPSKDIEFSACANKRVIKQTSSGGLHGFFDSAARCADPDRYIKTTVSCLDGENKRFNFGSVTCYGNTTENVACPKDQFMVVKTASYRGLSDSKTCGLSDDYSCTVDVTCLVKKQCDGQHECKITVNETLFSDDLCPRLKKYLYFEYQCIDTSKQYSLCVDNVHLSDSSLPNEGFIQIDVNYNGTKTVCWQSLKNNAKDVICRQLGHICNNPLLEDKERFPDSSFTASVSSEGQRASDARISSGSSWCASVSDGKHYLQVDLGRLYVLYAIATFSDTTGSKWLTSFNLNYTVDLVNWRRVQNGTIFQGNKNAYNDAVIRNLNYITTRVLRFIPLSYEVQPCMRIEICGDTLYPDQPRNITVFNIKSQSVEISWIDPENQGFTSVSRFWIKIKKHDSLNQNIITGKINEYIIDKLTPYTSYEISVAAGNKDGFSSAKTIMFSTREDALYPDQPRNLTVSNIKSRNVEISWIDPENQGFTSVSRFFIIMKKADNSLILNIITGKINEYIIDKLTPYTSYEISVAAGNNDGFSSAKTIMFSTREDAPEGPPLNVKVTAENSSSLSVTWDPPEEEKRNGVIVNYTVCISHEETKPCFKEHTTEKMMLVIDSLNASTKYFVRVLASTKVGRGNYSKSQGIFTNGEGTKMATKRTETTLTFSLQIPSENFTYFYVVALKLRKSSDKLPSPSNYDKNDLVTYEKAKTSAKPKPYIAAVITSRNKNMFILGDGGNTSFQTTRRRRSTTIDYYNGPLESGASYSIFQRIFLDDKGEFYSTDWSPPSTTLSINSDGVPRVLTNMSSGDVMAKEGDLVNLLCSAQGEPPITFSWEKDGKPLESFIEKNTPYRSSVLVVTIKDEKSFGKYICNIQDRFTKTAHTISVVKLTGAQGEGEDRGNLLVGIIVLIIILVILLIIIAYLLFHRVHRLKSSSTTGNLERKTKDSSKDIYENPNKNDVDNYEQVENEQSTYTALKRPGKDEDDHVYSHLNKRPQEYENQKETGL
ncbi:uncharacterized protein LOC114525343 [Dendronephthya gigantea]|uniref:uncharacterized protein LOC114525343 n=1 Tax=Dendronephthya gigantea TaxID=151771 RepID=UPI00106D84DB|nr:uncharacterized protein LOC114525343 [Dendronephthya gigantea]